MKVHLFARARELAGTSVLEIALPSGSTVADLRRLIAKEYPQLASLLERSAIGVNNEFAADDWTLPDGAEVALLPPVSGG